MFNKNFEINGKDNITCTIYSEENVRNLKRIVIFCHGFAGNKDNNAAKQFAQTITSKEKKTGVLVFNWPAHGNDIKKRLLLNDCDNYLEAVLGYVRDTMNISDIYAYGVSFGAYMLLRFIHTKGDNPFRKIALRCPAVSMYKVMCDTILKEDDYRILSKGRDVMAGFDVKVSINQTFLDELKASDIFEYDYIDFADDILVLHGLKDEIVPFDDVQEFCEKNVLELIAVENADHRFSDLNILKWANHKVIEFFRSNDEYSS